MLCVHMLCFLILVALVRCREESDAYQRLATLEAKVVLGDLLQMALLAGKRDSFKSILEDAEGGASHAELTFAVGKLLWHNRTDGQETLNNSTCDVLMAEYDDWSEIDVVTRSFVRDCVRDRLVVDFVRMADPELGWLPQDLLTNPWRKFVFGADLVKSVLVYWQHDRDQRVPLETWRNATYAHLWDEMTLSVAHYTGVETQPELDAFRLRHSLDDYMRWNRAGQRDAVVWLARTLDRLFATVFTADDVATLQETGAIMTRVLFKNDK